MGTGQGKATAGLGVASAAVMALAATGASAAGGSKDAVLAANAQFYSALNIMFTGDATPMAQIWSHADDATYMGPDGKFLQGWSAIGANWNVQANLKLGGHVAPVEMQVVAGPMLGVVSAYEQGENTNANGKAVKVRMRATNVFRLEDGQWKMIGHHTDLLPYMNK